MENSENYSIWMKGLYIIFQIVSSIKRMTGHFDKKLFKFPFYTEDEIPNH